MSDSRSRAFYFRRYVLRMLYLVIFSCTPASQYSTLSASWNWSWNSLRHSFSSSSLSRLRSHSVDSFYGSFILSMVCLVDSPFLRSTIEPNLVIATIAQLAARKQRYKLGMFSWLYRILMMTVFVIAVFFVVSSLTFSGRLAEGTVYIPFTIYCLDLVFCSKITVQNLGRSSGGSLMDGLPSSTSLISLLLVTYGDPHQTTEDKCHSCVCMIFVRTNFPD